MADIFISYTSSDRDWAFWIAKELQSLGHVARVHEWEIKAGESIYAWMEKAHHEADRVLCVLSDDYLDRVKAPYSAVERDAALWQAASKRPGFVLFVAVKASKLPTLADHFRRCELFGIPKDAAQLRLREFMQKREGPAEATFPGKVFAVSNIPIRVPEHFLGRDNSLIDIESTLRRRESSVVITALHGLRGVGKTVLAAAYAERHRDDCRATWWVRAQTDSTMRADLVALGVRLGWVAADEKEEPALTAVMERLRQEGEGILLIYDNAVDADGLKPYLPRGGTVRVLVTSNAHAWRGVAQPIEIRIWPKEVGAEYLIDRTGRIAERTAAEALSDALGGLPLAHEQAAAYCERLGISLAEYLNRFNAAPERLLDDTRDAPREYYDRTTVAKTFALAIDEAAKLHLGADPLIVHAALLAPEPIPLFLFAERREKFGEPLGSALAGDGLDEAVAALRAFALVDRESIADERDPSITTDCIRLHRLVRQVAQTRCESTARNVTRGNLIEAVLSAYPERIWRDPDTWPRVRRLDAIALALVCNDAAPSGAEQSTINLLVHLGQYRQWSLASYTQAKQFFVRAVATCEKVLGPEHLHTAGSLGNLALLLEYQGDLAAARPLFERTLAIHEKLLGPEHELTATSLNNLGRLLRQQGDLAAARPLFERALAIDEKVLGCEHPDTATSLNNLARLLQAQGDLAGARLLQERDLSISEKVLGPEHPDTAASLNNLALLLRAQDELAAARALFERAMIISDKSLGPDHLYTNVARINLAGILLRESKRAEALALSTTALTAVEKTLGKEHPSIRHYARISADALDALGRGAEAAALREHYGIDGDGKPNN